MVQGLCIPFAQAAPVDHDDMPLPIVNYMGNMMKIAFISSFPAHSCSVYVTFYVKVQCFLGLKKLGWDH